MVRALIPIAAAAALATAENAAAQPTPEEAVKAAFVTRFPAFIDWASPPRQQVICTVGEDAVVLSLAAAGVSGAELRRLQSVTPASGCTVVYVAGSPRQSVGQALQALDDSAVLTITDSSRSSARGIIHFTVQRSRVRFIIDAGRAQRNGLSISSKLLDLAAGVTR